MSKQVKKLTTGLTGLKVSPNPKRTLGILYAKTSRALNKLPADCAYRKYTESIISQRSAIIKEVSALASGCGPTLIIGYSN
ncbi:unnamed protein product [Nesidiocoris tenuis]|uniref:Uncharacterized protein n=1 Tax=Nesidiocoris tenuis TaxID=355587 RepID=A0A6H5H4C3_9HEMI|nr:unnamed protein product [Nesidiocoris tenuis]